MFTKKTSKSHREFIKLLKRAYNLIKLKKFSEAVALYHKIEDKYKSLSEKYKTEKLKNDIHILYKELTLYLRVNEAFIYSEEGDMERLKLELSNIHSSLYDITPTEETKPLLDYVQDHYKFFLEIYSFKSSKEAFSKKYNFLVKLVHNNKIPEARKLYSQLIIEFNKLSEFLDEYQKERLYSKLTDILREISIKTIIKKSSKKKSRKIIKRPTLTKQQTKKQTLKPLPEKPKNEYEELRKLLKKGNVAEAQDIYSKL